MFTTPCPTYAYADGEIVFLLLPNDPTSVFEIFTTPCTACAYADGEFVFLLLPFLFVQKEKEVDRGRAVIYNTMIMG